MENKDQNQIVGAILIVGLMIAGAILLKGSSSPVSSTGTTPPTESQPELDKVSIEDQVIGNSKAKVVLVEYADFQCSFCAKFFFEVKKTVIDEYVDAGKIQFVFRDYAFLGPESFRSAQAARCASDQNKFWEYHDHLFINHGSETFSDINLKKFAGELGLNTTTFNQCLDSGKYEKFIIDSVNKANIAGVRGTPKGYILKNGKVVSTIEGAESAAMVKAKLDAALK